MAVRSTRRPLRAAAQPRRLARELCTEHGDRGQALALGDISLTLGRSEDAQRHGGGGC